MYFERDIKQQILTAPYYNTGNSAWEYTLMRSLRAEVLPKIRRRMPWHHLSGWRADSLTVFVAKHKNSYGYFLRTDISRFYPSLRQTDLLLYMQLAYRDLLGLPFVPRQFKKKYVPHVKAWIDSLPLDGRGIPVASPVSALLAPLMLVPLWLRLIKRFDIKLLVFADDILVMCRTKDVCGEVFAYLHNNLLGDYELLLQNDKTYSGRFSSHEVDFCGWNFKGGYARISQAKVKNFQERIQSCVKTNKDKDIRPFLKTVNHKIDGFGNYYKHGDVAKQFAALDIFLRREIRRRFGGKNCGNKQLKLLGLHSLEDKLKQKKRQNAQKASSDIIRPAKPGATVAGNHYLSMEDKMQVIRDQLTQLIRLQRTGNRYLKDIADKLAY